MGKRVTIMIDADLDKKLRLRQAKIISLLLLSVLVTLSITFDESFAHPDPPHKNDPSHQYYLPTLIFDEKDYPQDSTIPATCTPDDSKSVRSLDWRIVNTDIHRSVLHEKHQQEDYSFLANFEEGNYKINCRTGFVGGGYSLSEWKEFSISGIVDSAEPTSTDLYNGLPDFTTQAITPYLFTNEVDMKYDPATKNLTISWNFGDNPYRQGCYSKTQIGYYDYTQLFPLRYGDGDDLNFEGNKTSVLGHGSLYLKNVNLSNAVIDCQGSIVFNPDDVYSSSFTDEFSLYMTFFEVIDSNHQSEYDDFIRDTDGIRVLNEAQFVTTTLGDLESATCGELDSSTDEWRFVELIYDTTGPNKIVYESLDGCYSDNPTSFYSMKQTSITQTQKKNGSGCSGDCTAPTIGVDKDGIRFVDDGLKLNGVSFDGDYFKNHMPMQYTEIGKMNHLQLKVYENSGLYNIDIIQFGIVKEIGSPINLAEPRIEIDVSNFANDVENPSLDGTILIDKMGIISYYDVAVSIVPCMVDSNQECLKLDIYWSFAKVPEFNVLVINGWDNDRNPFNSFFNDGITVTDPNYVEPEIIQPYKYECKDLPLEEIKVWNRINCNFDNIIITEQEKALLIFDSTKIISIPGESFTYDLPKSDTEQQTELNIRINNEIDRLIPLTKDYAKNQYLYQQDSYNHWNYFGDMTVAEINKLDMENKQKLQNEMLQQRLDDKAKYG